jgi:hypothetical protein
MTLFLILIGANVAAWCWLGAKATRQYVADGRSDPLAPSRQVRTH